MEPKIRNIDITKVMSVSLTIKQTLDRGEDCFIGGLLSAENTLSLLKDLGVDSVAYPRYKYQHSELHDDEQPEKVLIGHLFTLKS